MTHERESERGRGKVKKSQVGEIPNKKKDEFE
jgi:hypothetical protein